jgi:hypothetical protein
MTGPQRPDLADPPDPDHPGRGRRAYRVGQARRAHRLVLAALAAAQISESFGQAICRWTDKLPEDDREMADEILLAAAARGMVLADLAGLAGEMYERSRSGQPDEDKDRPFDDRAVKLATTFGGAGVLHGDLTPEITIVETVLDAARRGTRSQVRHRLIRR